MKTQSFWTTLLNYYLIMGCGPILNIGKLMNTQTTEPIFKKSVTTQREASHTHAHGTKSSTFFKKKHIHTRKLTTLNHQFG